MKNNRGSILIFCFWAMIFLSILGYGITRRLNAELSLVKYQVQKAQSKYAAFAGLFYTLDQIQKDLNDEDTKDHDTFYDCGLALKGGDSPEGILSGQAVGEAEFDVMIQEDSRQRFALEDESGKLNVNGLQETNYRIFKELLTALGIDEESAQIIASSVIDWKDGNGDIFNGEFGAEQDYYQQLNPAYDCKNNYFESLEELLLVRGMTVEIFEKIRPYVTVFPYDGALRVNFSTALQPVLSALAMSVTGAKTNTDESDAESFVRKLVEYRQGADGEDGTADDEPVTLGDFSLFSGPEIAIASAIRPFQISKASVIRAQVRGRDDQNRTQTILEAIIQTDGLRVVSLNIQ